MIYKRDFALDPTCHLVAGDRCMQQIICFPISNFGTRPTPDFHSMCVVRMSKVVNQVESFTNVMRGIFSLGIHYVLCDYGTSGVCMGASRMFSENCNFSQI